MTTLTLDLLAEVFSALRLSPEEFGRELRLAAAIHWYERDQLSQEMAAQVAGLDRTDFLMALARRGVDAFSVEFQKTQSASSTVADGASAGAAPLAELPKSILVVVPASVVHRLVDPEPGRSGQTAVLEYSRFVGGGGLKVGVPPVLG